MKNHIHKMRKDLGLRQKDLADAVGVSRQTINAVENGKDNPTLALALRLAKFLKTPVEELFLPDYAPGQGK